MAQVCTLYELNDILTCSLDGILGIGPDRLSMYNNPENKIIPTLVTTMHEKDVINQKVFSVYFQPITTKQPRINGEIVFGGVEAKHVVGDIKYAPVTNKKTYTVTTITIFLFIIILMCI